MRRLRVTEDHNTVRSSLVVAGVSGASMQRAGAAVCLVLACLIWLAVCVHGCQWRHRHRYIRRFITLIVGWHLEQDSDTALCSAKEDQPECHA